MSKLQSLKSAVDRRDLAAVLGYTPKALAFILYKIPQQAKYTEFTIPKRTGGERTIHAPMPHLRALQRQLANVLTDALKELEGQSSVRRFVSHGFAPGRTIITNASAHKCKRYVLNLDLEDFFPSINFGRIRGVLMKDKRFELQEPVATTIAQIACHDDRLPQGSPCSPVLSNIVGHLLDVRLVRLAKKYRCTYTRYADDITFSTNQKHFPAKLAAPDPNKEGAWILGAELAAAITKAGYGVNAKKTRMQMRGSRQEVTGLVSNAKVNVRKEYYRNVRSMCATLFGSGEYYRMVPATLVGGGVDDPDVKEVQTSTAALEGMLEHIYRVRDASDLRDSAEKKKDSTATRKLYHKLLFYKRFVSLERPLILTEGPSDHIYLRAAIEHSLAYHPGLVEIVDGSPRFHIDFLRYSRRTHDILQLGGGTGDLKHLIINYKECVLRYGHRALSHPVIMLIDNDGGADPIMKTARNFGAAGISLATTDPFYRLDANLYLVKTPELGQNHQSCIEDLFDPALLLTEVDGKKFDKSKLHGDATSYGKVRFADKVVSPNRATIDFTGFAPLLDRIVAVIDDYQNAPAWQP